ncbi:hypothetical protein [Aquimarina sp. AU119]|uniref:hypothetical protein n=1 Tax=Aquimarina sp. AU119 TaxID=2108528 RepID=UPI00135C5BFB|nr:hypothetical protein [Aquimarina sp. AU119]
MKTHLLIITLFIMNTMYLNSQNIDQSDINTTCFVLSELIAKAKEKGDIESMVIFSNTIDKIKADHNIHPTYSTYFDSIKSSNLNISKGIVISLNNPPKSPGFTNKEIDDFMSLRKDNISLSDLNDFLVLKKLGQNKLKLENLNELEIKNLEKFKKEIETIKINQ